MESDDFDASQKAVIITALKQAVDSTDTHVANIRGKQIEDRGSQITFSGLGPQAPIDEKEMRDSDFSKRDKIKAVLGELIPDFSVNLGGTTSIDFTKPGIDKAYGIGKLHIMLPGGNHYRAWQTGVTSLCMRDPEETKHVVNAIIACLSDSQMTATEGSQ